METFGRDAGCTLLLGAHVPGAGSAGGRL